MHGNVHSAEETPKGWLHESRTADLCQPGEAWGMTGLEKRSSMLELHFPNFSYERQEVVVVVLEWEGGSGWYPFPHFVASLEIFRRSRWIAQSTTV